MLGTSIGSDSNVAFVMTSQVLRVVLMLFAAPLVARMFLRFRLFASEKSATATKPFDGIVRAVVRPEIEAVAVR